MVACSRDSSRDICDKPRSPSTDAERKWAYDRTSHIGKLDKALDEANAKGWTVVGMKRDWKWIFPFESESADFRAMELMK
jgi:hypothetical protein